MVALNSLQIWLNPLGIWKKSKIRSDQKWALWRQYHWKKQRCSW